MSNAKGDTMTPQEVLKEFHDQHPDYSVIFLHISGSRLYGTELPTSDTDYRGVFIPPLEDLILKKDIEQWTSSTGGKTSKNTKDDIDVSLWSIHKFIKLLQVGDTNAFDTLFAYGTHAELFSSELFEEVYNSRELFYPESLRSFFGYALGQVKKYSIKGDKLRDVQVIRQYLEEIRAHLPDVFANGTISELRGNKRVPLNDNIQWVTDETNTYIKVLDKRFIQTVKLSEFLKKLKEIESKYGSRVKASMDNQSVDWKSLYHSFRVLQECKELMTYGRINFPLRGAKYLRKVRNQEYTPEECFEMLENLYDSVSLHEKSDDNYLKGVVRGDSDSLIFGMYH